MKIFIIIISVLINRPAFARVEKIYCGFSETAAWPAHTIVLDNPGSTGLEMVYRTSYGDSVFVFLTTMENIPNAAQTDMTLLIQSSQGTGFIEASARGLVESDIGAIPYENLCDPVSNVGPKFG